MRRNGFTLVELLIGMAITALVFAALATVTYAVSTNWKTAESVESTYMTGTQINARLGQWFRSASALGAISEGSMNGSTAGAAVFFWKGDATDNSYPNGDGKIQFDEIALLEHDTTSGEVRLYMVNDFATWTLAARTAANALAGTTYLNRSANFNDFKNACGTHRVLADNCTGMVIKKHSTDTPVVEYVMNVQRADGSLATYYGTISLRAAITAGN